MKRSGYLLGISFVFCLLGSCSNDDWHCKEDGKVMYSISQSGDIGSADRGCSCQEIRSFELRVFGAVDEEALKRDFGC